MNSQDNVATVLNEISRGDIVNIIDTSKKKVNKVMAISNLLIYHKIALEKIENGDAICKYGEVIGLSTKMINIGEHVHVQNVRSKEVK